MMPLVMHYAGLVLLGVAIFILSYGQSKRFLDWLRFQSIGTRDYIVEKLNLMFYEVNPNQVLLGLFGVSFGLGSVVFLLLLPNVFGGFLMGTFVTVIGWKLPKPIIDYMFKRRIDKFVLQMIDGLSLMSNGMKSGLSVPQSIGLVVDEMPNPIHQEFNLVLSQNKLGVSLEDALSNLGKRVTSDDVEMFVTSVNILKETGGNLAETFDTIVSTIRDRIKVENKIQALTAQGFYQGVILMAVPPGMGFIFYTTDPEFMKPMISTPLGWVLIMIIASLEFIAFFAINKVVKVDV